MSTLALFIREMSSVCSAQWPLTYFESDMALQQVKNCICDVKGEPRLCDLCNDVDHAWTDNTVVYRSMRQSFAE